MTEDVLASERVNALRESVKAWCRAEGLSTWDRRDQSGMLRNLVVREGRRTGQLQARLVTSPGDFRDAEFAAAVPADSVLWTRAAGVAETTRDGETKVLRGKAKLEEELSGLTLPDLPRRVLPDEHGDGGAPLRHRRGAGRADRQASACWTSSAASARSP